MFRIFLITIILIIHTSVLAWELVLDKGGVKIYKKKSANSRIHEIKGTAIISGPMLQVLTVVLDYKKFHYWQPNLITFERLKVISDKEFINYAAMSMPWPVKPRDTVMRAWFLIDSGNRWFHVHWQETTWPTKPETSKFIRVPKSRVRWSLKPVKNGKMTQVEFKALGDPGGLIPSWLVNWFSKYMIAESFTRMQTQVKKGDFNKEIMKQFQYVESWY